MEADHGCGFAYGGGCQGRFSYGGGCPGRFSIWRRVLEVNAHSTRRRIYLWRRMLRADFNTEVDYGGRFHMEADDGGGFTYGGGCWRRISGCLPCHTNDVSIPPRSFYVVLSYC